MVLVVQLQVLVFSFVYGILFSYLLRINHRFLFESKLFYKIIGNIVFVFDNSLLYFLILKKINNGIFHIYFLFLLVIGYLLGTCLIKKQ